MADQQPKPEPRQDKLTPSQKEIIHLMRDGFSLHRNAEKDFVYLLGRRRGDWKIRFFKTPTLESMLTKGLVYCKNYMYFLRDDLKVNGKG